MSKPGDLVEFKAGTFGLQAPHNVGILLDRRRVKGVSHVEVWTAKGRQSCKADQLTKRAFKARFDGRLDDERSLAARLAQLTKDHQAGQLAEEAEDDLARLEQAMWESVCDDPRLLPGYQPPAPPEATQGNPTPDPTTFTEAEVAARHYQVPAGQAPSATQLRDVRSALDRCRRRGTGRFQTAGRGDLWRPWSRAEHDAMRLAWSHLEKLRSRLVATVAVDEAGQVLPQPTGSGGPSPGHVPAGASAPAPPPEGAELRFQGMPLAQAGLTDKDHATLAWVRDAMAQFVEWDGVPQDGQPIRGIGGLGAVQAFGMDLHRQLGFLALDWSGAEPTSTSSLYVQFLLRTGLMQAREVVDLLIRRHVNAEPFFEHVDQPDAEAAAEAFPDPTPEPDRNDLRHLACYTIDPPDAKDFDDAVGLEDLGAGALRLWVHVADVSHYVRPDTLLDRHARSRATSVYLPGRVLPMLPHRLSDHLCSLRDDGDRYALSIGIDVDGSGKTGATQFHKALIRVTENLSYGKALERARAGVEPFRTLLDLAKRMREHRRGLELETGELKVILEGAKFSALEKHADDATRMIETFMVAGNEAVARHLHAGGVPQLFRCHPLPDPQKAQRFQHQAETLGLPLDMGLPRKVNAPALQQAESLLDQLKAGGGKLNLFGGGIQLGGDRQGKTSSDPPPAALTPAPEPVAAMPGFSSLSPDEQEAWLKPFRAAVNALSEIPDRELAEVGTLKLLGCMGRAHYSPDNEGHFGLASTHYCHFTSPIRRYPDLVVHRNLKWLLGGRKGEAPHTQASLRAMCDHCSNQEQAADALERRIKASTLVLASLGADSGVARARVTGITPTSLFVARDDNIEARIAVRDLPGGPYHADEWESMLFVEEREVEANRIEDVRALRALLHAESGELRRIRVRLGDKVTVRLAQRDVAAGKTGAQLVSW